MYPAGGFQRAKQDFLNFRRLHVAVGSESFWQQLVLTISQEKYISWLKNLFDKKQFEVDTNVVDFV